jgi:hypothetical protein
MSIPTLHSWDLTPKQAVAPQRELASRIVTDVPLSTCNLVAGADCSYNRFSTTMYAGVVVLRADDLSVVERKGAVGEATFPHVPGLLSFREMPLLLQTFSKLENVPDLVIYEARGMPISAAWALLAISGRLSPSRASAARRRGSSGVSKNPCAVQARQRAGSITTKW